MFLKIFFFQIENPVKANEFSNIFGLNDFGEIIIFSVAAQAKESGVKGSSLSLKQTNYRKLNYFSLLVLACLLWTLGHQIGRLRSNSELAGFSPHHFFEEGSLFDQSQFENDLFEYDITQPCRTYWIRLRGWISSRRTLWLFHQLSIIGSVNKFRTNTFWANYFRTFCPTAVYRRGQEVASKSKQKGPNQTQTSETWNASKKMSVPFRGILYTFKEIIWESNKSSHSGWKLNWGNIL